MRTVLAALALVMTGCLLAWNARSAGAEDAAQELDRVRASPTLADDPRVIDALARDLTAFPPPMRLEARLLVAEAWLGRMHRPDDAIGLLRAVTDDPEADPLTTRLAEREIVDALTDEGRLDDAVVEAESHAHRLDPRLVMHTRTLVHRRTIRRAAVVELGAFALLAGAAVARGLVRGSLGEVRSALRRVTPVAIGFAAYLAAGGGLLASAYETGNAAPFALLGPMVLLIILAARAWSALGSNHAIARAGRATLCAVSVLAAAFLVLDAVNPTYLDGFGL